MMTLKQFSGGLESIPTTVSWYLADLGEARGKQELYEERVGETASPRGAKAGLVMDAIRKQLGEFRLVDLERACPGVGREWIRRLLAELKEAGEVAVSGRGPAARWRLLGAAANKGTTSK